MVASHGEQAAKMLVKADPGFLRDAGGIGIQGLEKIPNLLPDLRSDERDGPTAWCNDLPWLDRVVHVPLYTAYPQRNLT
jgi:hypothetical protein